MNYLLDTHVLLWSTFEVRRLRANTRTLVADPTNQIFFSVATIWEVAIKRSRGRPDFQIDPEFFRVALLRMGYRELEIASRHAIEAGSLPLLHQDPFDRILIAQARVENMLLLTVDKKVLAYGSQVVSA